MENYKTYSWKTGYIWKQGRVIQYTKVLDLQPENRHHAACLMALHDATSHLMSYLLDNGEDHVVQKILTYTGTYGHEGQLRYTADPPCTRAGHPKFYEYITSTRTATRSRAS